MHMKPNRSEAGTLGALVAEARRGCTQSRSQLFELCRDYLLLIANREMEEQLRSKAGASDLVQETIIEAYGGFERFRGESEAEFYAWIRRILKNHLSNFARSYRSSAKRRASREVPIEEIVDHGGDPPDGGESPSVVAIRHELEQDIGSYLGKLPSHYREVLLLRHWEEMTFEEIAMVTGRTADAARMLWWRAVDRLSKLLEAEQAYAQKAAR
ncbi:sigma-70 family RNA polymerase sigma factor [Tautonia plasticadhaerens]|uniref:ECF RNA polymerase sigma factor SigH n=1 Tax=Tautonia plasticadhaerens TaxID=2527974 RepID=A0A518GWW5_9BACT|nr:sigma-70 family RNA polymerase sigma factor [Tautonia plasticadhaerens]QDV33051.1 ECF RNA polymerase sigma factor SigH [Tautonia plasticadhaerens]